MSKFNRGEGVVNTKLVTGVVLGSYLDWDGVVYVVYRASKEQVLISAETELLPVGTTVPLDFPNPRHTKPTLRMDRSKF